jgi:Flp pilus assembly protein TadD
MAPALGPLRRRPVGLALLLAAAIAVAVSVWVPVPQGRIGIRSNRFGTPSPTLIAPGWHVRIPLIQSIRHYPFPVLEVEGSVTATTPEGIGIRIPYRLELRTRSAWLLDQAGRITASEWERQARAGLAEAWTGIVAGIAADRLVGTEGEEGLRAAASESLRFLGLDPGSIEIGPIGAADAGGQMVLDRLRIRAGVDRDVQIVLIGWDGADWGIIEPLIASGQMPNLARLRQEGAWGRMRSGSPTLSPLLWTTVATGRRPEEHGIVDFLVLDPETGRHVPISSNFRRVRAIWNIFTEFDLSSTWIAWWATWPAERIRGVMITDRVAYSLFPAAGTEPGAVPPIAGLTHPEGILGELETARRNPEQVGFENLSRFVDLPRSEWRAIAAAAEAEGTRYAHPILHLRQVLASTATYHGMALQLLDRQPHPNLFAVYYQGIDEVSHRFAHYLPPRMTGLTTEIDFRRYRDTVPRFYAYQDRLLGELLERVPEQAYLLLLSDHGFAHGGSRPRDVPPDIEGRPGKWHAPYGIYLLRGPGVEPGRRKPASLYQIAPTLLSLVGLPLAADMSGRPLEGTPGAAAGEIATYEGSGPPPDGTRPQAGGDAALEADMLEKLRSLGYIEGGDGDTAAAVQKGGTTLFHSNLAISLMVAGDFDEARKEYGIALEMQPESIPALTGMSELAARQGDFIEALEWARRAIEAGLDVDPLFYLWTADLFLRADLPTDGRDYFTRLHDQRPGFTEISVALGRQWAALGHPDRAEQLYWDALAAEPACLPCLEELFEVLDPRDEASRLEEPIRTALKLGVRDIMPRNWLGLIYKRLGRDVEAEAIFQAILDEHPDHTGTLANLGSLYLEQGRYDLAVAVLERGREAGPRRREVLVNLLLALAGAGRMDDAETRFLQEEEGGELHPSIYNAMAYGYYLDGQPERAEAMARHSLDLDPDQPEVTELLSTILGTALGRGSGGAAKPPDRERR